MIDYKLRILNIFSLLYILQIFISAYISSYIYDTYSIGNCLESDDGLRSNCTDFSVVIQMRDCDLTLQIFSRCYTDERLRERPFMDSPVPILTVFSLYLLMVKQGPKTMEIHKPLQLQGAMVFYNLSVMLLSLYITVEVTIMIHPTHTTLRICIFVIGYRNQVNFIFSRCLTLYFPVVGSCSPILVQYEVPTCGLFERP